MCQYCEQTFNDVRAGRAQGRPDAWTIDTLVARSQGLMGCGLKLERANRETYFTLECPSCLAFMRVHLGRAVRPALRIVGLGGRQKPETLAA